MKRESPHRNQEVFHAADTFPFTPKNLQRTYKRNKVKNQGWPSAYEENQRGIQIRFSLSMLWFRKPLKTFGYQKQFVGGNLTREQVFPVAFFEENYQKAWLSKTLFLLSGKP
ncbi:MAG: hypothetical protein U5L09_00215 [Bacteroidales bacterium]|nr:hypothetical protein [Bacteroidales bacterium]